MANFTMVFSLFILATAGTLILSGNHALAQQCADDWKSLEKECKQFVQIPGKPTEPSSQCCDVIKRADIPCCCNYVNPDIEKIIDMNKLCFVVDKCGKPFAHGSKCGSFTVPKA